MKLNVLLVLIVVILLLGFSGCAKHRYLTLPIDSTQKGCVDIYLEDKIGDREVVTDLGGLTSASKGLLYAGKTPLNLYFYYQENEGTWTKGLVKYISLPKIIGVWPSGAKVLQDSQTISIGDGAEPIFFRRPPESEFSGLSVDLQCEANEIAKQRNAIEQEGVDKHGSSNIIGAGILCFMSGYCR